MWKSEEKDSVTGLDLKRLLLEQPSVKPYYKNILFNHGFSFQFQEPSRHQLLFRIKDFFGEEPLLLLPHIDPEVLAILVNKFPEEMLSILWRTKYFQTDVQHCNRRLLTRYRSTKRAKTLLRIVYGVAPFSLRHLVDNATFLGFYLNQATIRSVIKGSKTYEDFTAKNLEKLLPHLDDHETMLLFYKKWQDNSMAISLRFLEVSLRLGVPLTEVKRCINLQDFPENENISVAFKHLLLEVGVSDEAFLITFFCKYNQDVGSFSWTVDDDMIAAQLGYSETCRGMIEELSHIKSN